MTLRKFSIKTGCRQLFVLVAAIASGCEGPKTKSDAPTTTFRGNYPIKVVCTTGPVTDMLRQLGGDHLAVTGLMGPGVDPHLYRALPSDRKLLLTADIVFYNGLHLEGRMTEVLEELNRQKRTIAVTHDLVKTKDQRLRKPPEFDGYHDPHVWHDPRLWADCAKYVAAMLAEFDPTNRADYEQAAKNYLDQIHAADEYCRTQLAAIPREQRALVTAHDAFNYFCTAYDLTSMPLKGVSTEEEIPLGRMDEVVNYLIENKVKAVFVESAVAPKIVEALIDPCARKGHTVKIGGELYADALGSCDSGADTYLGMIKANVDTIVSALK
jgi:manganese/zinc/iron transport system substrate-binding protein